MSAIQVKDNVALLNLMNEDMQRAPVEYNPTNYWAHYEKRLWPELNEKGLHDFRRRRRSVLRSFGATDCAERPLVDLRHNRLVYNRVLNTIPGWTHMVNTLSRWASGVVAAVPAWKRRRELAPYKYVSAFGDEHGAPPLAGLEISLAGNPEDVVMAEGKPYTYSMLYYYMRFAFAHRFVDFNKLTTVVELGSGAGKNVEITMKYYPHLTYLVFDISPQLYVCEQYLRAVFGDRVVGYSINRQRTDLNHLEPGKIYIFGAWHFPLLARFPFDLFWNCASFQEMEPDVVLNYLSYVNRSARMVYLMAKMDGQDKASRKGEFGVMEQVVYEHYERGLSNFEMVDFADCYYPNGRRMWEGYEETFWKRVDK